MHMNDATFDALAAADRRRVLSLLANRREDDPPLRVPDDLATGRQASEATATRLHHVHLPKLASMDYVEWDPDSGAVRRGPAFEELEPVLSVLNEYEGKASD